MSTASRGRRENGQSPGKPDPGRESLIRAILALKRTVRTQQRSSSSNGDFTMNKTVLAILMCSMFALPASAATISGGKITSVDAGGTSFNYSKKKKNWKFRITDRTVVRVGQKTGNLSDLKTGQSVKVEFQRQSGSLAALTIIGIGF
jgi:hypothetical protein